MYRLFIWYMYYVFLCSRFLEYRHAIKQYNSLSFRQYSARARKRSRFIYPLDTSISNHSFWLMFSANVLDFSLTFIVV